MTKVILSQEQQDRILQKLRQVEKSVDIEIVPMIVSSSSVTRHVSLILFLFFAAAFIFLDFQAHIWLSPIQEALVFAASLLAAYFLSRIVSTVSWVQRFLTADLDEEIQVKNRAELEFYKGLLNSTDKRNVTLLFVSLMERRSAIFSDRAIRSKLSDQEVEQIKQALSKGLRSSTVDHCFMEAMSLIELFLKEKMPADQSKINSISDDLIIKE